MYVALRGAGERRQQMWAARAARQLMRRFVTEEDGISTIEIILIIVVLIGLVIIFKSQLTSLVNSTLSRITSQAGSI
jgi:Flp pilus assembly pilin Flp